ncbi:Coenzyme F420-reducing hydrogenase, beta subunit [Lachnospiraceae bacterium]|nr:Coenzyme F420-reducing hydrogenase, beta subunit [Lachnospiraceae bacterium]
MGCVMKQTGKNSKTAIQINQEPDRCSGCGACRDICPVSAIKMEENEKGFLYPKVNVDMCVYCGKCKDTCPLNRTTSGTEPIFYAVRIKDIEKRMKSQSGGAFTILAENILSEDGVVYGAAVSEKLKVQYLRVTDVQELEKLKGSKYVQADLGNTYTEIEKDLKAGRTVLFSGTPCGVDGLLSYLDSKKIDQNKLLTCDLICHGVPSPLVYRKYLDYIRKTNGEPTTFVFRDKKNWGWRQQAESYVIDGKLYSSQVYTSIFSSNLALRESCYKCRYATVIRRSDITIGDYWGVEKLLPEMEKDDTGISLVMIRSEKAVNYLLKNEEQIEIWESEKSKSFQWNLAFPTLKPRETELFWNNEQKQDIRFLIRNYVYSQMRKQLESDRITVIHDGKEEVVQFLLNNEIRKVIIFGRVGKETETVWESIRDSEVQVIGFVDIFEEYPEATKVFDLSIVSFEEAKSQILKGDAIAFLTDETNMVDIQRKLYRNKIPFKKMIPISFVLQGGI